MPNIDQNVLPASHSAMRNAKPIAGALPDLGAAQVILRAPNAGCMRGFSPSAEALAIGRVDIANVD